MRYQAFLLDVAGAFDHLGSADIPGGYRFFYTYSLASLNMKKFTSPPSQLTSERFDFCIEGFC